MTIIRHIEIKNFRGISRGSWSPCAGINGLIGAGDSGKSTLLDAIDLALAARRSVSFSDADFYNLIVSQPIEITITIGKLPDTLLDFESYGLFLRGWNDVFELVEAEPGEGLEPVLSVRLTVSGDLDPKWTLYSERAATDGVTRDLPYQVRRSLAPMRLGAFANHHFSWGARSVLNRISEERTSASEALAAAARQAREAFGDTASAEVGEAVKIVRTIAQSIGVRGAEGITALLDAHGVSFSGGTIALHDTNNVPLRNLGTGSSRLLVASLQAEADGGASISLIDELEHGLEPHRISRLLHTLGSKATNPEQQVFLTTHSPNAVRELAASQIWVVRRDGTGQLDIRTAGKSKADQATLRACPEAFLAPSVLVCEGKTEVGLARGLDLFWSSEGKASLAACGIAICEGDGGSMVGRAVAFAKLGYRTALWHDSDVELTTNQLNSLRSAGVTQFHWRVPFSTEQQLFDAVPDNALDELLNIAIDHVGKDSVDQQIRNQNDKLSLDLVRLCGASQQDREALGRAAGRGKWFKMVEPAERLGWMVLGPLLREFADPVPGVIANLRAWILNPPQAEADHDVVL